MKITKECRGCPNLVKCLTENIPLCTQKRIETYLGINQDNEKGEKDEKIRD